jgi:hypothetical protein
MSKVVNMYLASIAILFGVPLRSMARPIVYCSHELTLQHPWPEDCAHHYTIYPERKAAYSVLPPARNVDTTSTTALPTETAIEDHRAQNVQFNPSITVIRHEETAATNAVNSTNALHTNWALLFNISTRSPILYYFSQVVVDPIFLVLLSISLTLFTAAQLIPER